MESPLTVTLVADRKFGKFYEQVFEPACEAAGMTDHRFQLLLEQEKGLRVRTRVEQLLCELNGEIMESATIFVDYDEPNAIVTAFEANNFESKLVELDLATIQVAGSGKVNHQVFEWDTGRISSNRDVWPKPKDRPSFKYADFLTALKYALKLPDRQMQHGLIIPFEHDGKPCHLIIRRNYRYEGGHLYPTEGRFVRVEHGPLVENLLCSTSNDSLLWGNRLLLVRE